MSNDTAECGCEGHVSNFEECKYPALVARVAVLEAETRDFAKERRRLLVDRDEWVAKWGTSSQSEAMLRERLAGAEEGNRDLVRRAQQAESLLAHVQRNCESWRLMADRMRIRYEDERKRADTLSAAGQEVGDIEAYGLLKTGDDTRYPQRHPHAFAPNEHGLCGARVVGGHGVCGYAAHQHRYPCSSTCTHDDARTPGHPERVKERSEIVASASADPSLSVTEAACYEQGAEAMRVACLAAAMRWAESERSLSAFQVKQLKAALKGVTP